MVVPPGDGAALADALVALADDPARRATLGAAGPAFVEERYSRRAVGTTARGVAGAGRAAGARARRGAPAGGARRRRQARGGRWSWPGSCSLVLSPLLVAVALAVRLDSPGPALFRQRRVGRASREFTILKFRTMRVGTPDLASHLMGPGSDRVTRVGRWLRRTSLDELPQLLNVLAGDMSLVGPRPALHNQHDLVALRQQAGVDALKPGVTGWAQIHGRDDLPLDRKVAYDRWYLEHVSLGLDLGIALRTPLRAVLLAGGVLMERAARRGARRPRRGAGGRACRGVRERGAGRAPARADLPAHRRGALDQSGPRTTTTRTARWCRWCRWRWSRPRRERLRALPRRGDWRGLALVALACALQVLGAARGRPHPAGLVARA